ncbi:hypothetical protein, partial [Neisseria meningitidis]|uniref:hypothetical protein n=1 Tax=Neisseria meningitidis TaxID=487 RepID=UPI001C86CBAF
MPKTLDAVELAGLDELVWQNWWAEAHPTHPPYAPCLFYPSPRPRDRPLYRMPPSSCYQTNLLHISPSHPLLRL